MLTQSLERNQSIKGNIDLGRVTAMTLCLLEDQAWMGLESINDLLNKSIRLSLDVVATKYIVKEKTNLLRHEMSKAVSEAISYKNNLTVVAASVNELKERV